MRAHVDKLVNVGLRSATLASRFLFIFFLAKFLTPAEVGYYGIFTATVGYALYFVGLDFYVYTTREILKAEGAQRGTILTAHILLSVSLYIIFVPVFLAVLTHLNWPTHLMILFFPILVLEHFNQEVFRLLVALSQQIAASVVLFIRQGSWALITVGLMVVDASSRNLQLLLLFWVGAGALAAVLGTVRVWQLRFGGWLKLVQWDWLKRGVVVSVAFLIATLALRGIQTVDRYWLEWLSNIELVGAYVLFIGVASTLMVFLDAGLFSFFYPEIIRLHQQSRNSEAKQKVFQLAAATLIVCVAFSAVSWVALPVLLQWIGKPIYLDNIWLYKWLLLATILNAFGMVPHYALYAQGRDKAIIGAHLAALVAFVAFVALTGPYVGALAVPAGLGIAFALILAIKTCAYLAISRQAD